RPHFWFVCRGPSRHRFLLSFPTRRSSDLAITLAFNEIVECIMLIELRVYLQFFKPGYNKGVFYVFVQRHGYRNGLLLSLGTITRSEEHTSELQSRENLVCRLLLEKKNSLS